MKHIEMTDITTSARGKDILVPGGWSALVPQVQSVDEETRVAYTQYFQRNGLPPAAAERRAIATVQSALEQGFVRGLRHSIARYARIYAKRFSSLHQEDGTLLGFSPGKMQGAFVPNENTGRRGKQFVDGLLGEMAAAAREEGRWSA